MASLKEAYNFVIEKCKAANVRYSMDENLRRGGYQDGLQYYDCSSLMYACLQAGGFYQGVTDFEPWFWTAIMREELPKLGFTEYDASTTEWKPGDILLRLRSRGHTEMVYSLSPLSSMGARGSTLPAEEQVEIHETNKTSWQYLFRCKASDDDLNGQPIPTEWINKDDYLTESEKLNNARIVWASLIREGWTEYSIAALLGNMDQESNINPGFSQRGGGTGYGLVQWTPGTRWKNWADERGYSYDDGNGQLLKIVEEMTADGQDEWYTTKEIYGDNPPNGEYLLSRNDFITNPDRKSIAYLTSAWLWEYERPNLADAMESYRQERAQHWYNILHGYTPIPDPGFELPIWLLWKIREVNNR